MYLVRTYRMVSGDSHLQVPADFWTDRVPKKFRDLTPKRVKLATGGEVAKTILSIGSTGTPTRRAARR